MTEAEWGLELAAAKKTRLSYQGWTKESGPLVEFFIGTQVATWCRTPCEKCAFHFLNDKGEELKRTDTPLCGEW